MEGDLGWCRSSNTNNWDLHAVVRFGCGHGAPPPPTDDVFPWPPPLQPQRDELVQAGGWQPLPTDPAVDELCEALLAAPKLETPQPNEAPPQQQPPADEAPAKPRPSGRGGGGPTRSKRKSKKSQVNKEVTRVPAGGPSADLWAWRKYGQKPIKGSPYPRGYYRCSTDKDCKARKQVERCRTDPATHIVTYTGEHSHPVPLHRNSLAGTTRNKPQPPSASSPAEDQPPQAQSPLQSESAGRSTADDTKPQGSPSVCAGLSPGTPLRSPSVGVDYEEEEDDDTLAVRLLLEDTEMVAEDDTLLFFNPDELIPAPGTNTGGCEAVMLLPEPNEPATVPGTNAGGCDDVMLFPKTDELAPGPVSSGGCKDVMLFPKSDEPPPSTASTSITHGGGGMTPPVINFTEEKFSFSGISAWEAAAASGWSL